ncbi:ABC transporter ATP-binding protein [Lentibacillus kapialis]|uniref:ABC transporter ATP-binding protein n=1 Tax=Lentibacillus kapialis TaxID=340214 RepID=A0A917PZQ7_9BACI|nr:ABC transporter ATP-binding protein [Lentibacillus kapialis]GGK02337.1 ABC transporter ATP-binding protein [Lentibacillus kapialis]
MSYIELRNISYKYPLSKANVLKNISYSFEKGNLYGIIGSNNSGKTTLCNLIKGLIPEFYEGELYGEVLIEGKDVRKWDSNILATSIGYIFQNPFSQISGIKETVFEEIALGLENLGIKEDEIIDRVIDVIKLLNITDLAKKNPNELSGGQRQRVAFASIVAMNNDILVIDEPTSQLDPQGTIEIFDIINKLKQQGKTIFLVEHKIDLIAEYADEVLVIDEGELKHWGKTNEILANKDLLNRGINLPQVALLSHEMENINEPFDQFAITKAEAKKQIAKRWG